ncbi:MAG: ubiquitin family protein [Planctomycetaceae bacterium]|jgi:hypothetical protein|nr:ubiquitin family protein [Planctomycetaceae bacterium]
MANINVKFLHPTDGTDMEAEVDDQMTAHAVINELLANNFIPNNPNGGYQLFVKGGREVKDNGKLADSGAVESSTIRVVPATDAGIRREQW